MQDTINTNHIGYKDQLTSAKIKLSVTASLPAGSSDNKFWSIRTLQHVTYMYNDHTTGCVTSPINTSDVHLSLMKRYDARVHRE